LRGYGITIILRLARIDILIRIRLRRTSLRVADAIVLLRHRLLVVMRDLSLRALARLFGVLGGVGIAHRKIIDGGGGSLSEMTPEPFVRPPPSLVFDSGIF
jgi:hypothetical protein